MSLLTKIDCFLRQSGMPPTTFGRRAANDPRLVGDMRLGRVPGPALTARVEAFIAGAQ
ncbi:MAG: hypothetical protein JO221_01745 [Sphingomonas sp.]|uniref:Uncharacterized protein n=1 Tax=Sphingomonas lycopersici TaxID=2951807 RepID=A0AA41ZAZ9_9SPHN|nr:MULTISPECIES: hypothetical protein [Sphingomonas]MBV8237470.1 hypothetical protein [Sphingomonas sp.]MCW6532059.1 hypothetical protein [Sphingomonas lycopersici]MCW6535861.1 hypothetical protein [Sphingomonas lycopersici]